MIPSPILCDFARDNYLLIYDGRAYQPSNKESDIYIIDRNNKIYLEGSESLAKIDEIYRMQSKSYLEDLRNEYLEKISGINVNELEGIVNQVKDDAVKLFYLTEVLNEYIDSVDRKNEFSQLGLRVAEEKKAYAEAILWLETNEIRPIISIRLPSYALIKDNRIFKIGRNFFGKEVVAVIQNKQYNIKKEVCKLEDLEDATKRDLEDSVINECQKINSQFKIVYENIKKFRGAIASEILGKNNFEYQNLGFCYCNGPIVYLKRDKDSTSAVAVQLLHIRGEVNYMNFPFEVQVKNGGIQRTDKNMCIATDDFKELQRELKHYKKGKALIRFLFSVRDRRGS